MYGNAVVGGRKHESIDSYYIVVITVLHSDSEWVHD